MTTAIHLSKKLFTTAVVVMTVLWSVGAAALISPLIAQGVAVADLSDGDLVMTEGAAVGATVYQYHGGKKYPYPNQNVFGTWYGADFSGVKRISEADMGSLAWGDNMLYRPGARLVKVPDDPKVYAVLPGGTVAWVKDEATAAKFYGSGWASRIDDLLASLFVASYTNDPAKDLTADSNYPDGSLLKMGSDHYYIEGGNKRMVSADALAQFNADYALEVTDVAAFSDGDAVGTGEFLNPVLVQEGATTPGADAPAPAAAGALTVSLAADSPTLRILDGTGLNPVARFNLAAGAAAVKVQKMKFKKVGTTANTNITGLRVVDGSGVRHGNVISSINDDNTFEIDFSSAPIEIAANGTATAEVQLDFNTSAGASDIKMEISESSWVATENATVSGSFPMQSFLIDVKDGNAIVTTVTFDLDGPANNTSVQMNAEIEVFNFTLRDTGSSEKTTFDGITLYNNGSVTDKDVQDFNLIAPNGDVLQTVQQSGKDVVFSGLAYEMQKGATKTFKVKVTPMTGATRTIDLQLQNDYDLKVHGLTSGHFILATADGSGTNDSSYPVGDASGYTDMTLASGTLTLDKANDSPTTNYAVAESDVVLGKFSLKASGEDMEIRRLTLSVYTSGSSTTALDGSYFIKSGGQTLYSAAFARALLTQTTTDADTTINLSTYLTIAAGETKDVEVVGNIGSAATSNDNYGANIDVTQLKRLTSGDLVDPGVSVVNASQRNVSAGALVVTNVSMAASGSYKIVAGTNGALAAKFTLNSSTGGEDARVNSFMASLTQGGVDGEAITDWSNWRLYRVGDDGSETLIPTSNNTDTGAASVTFTFTTAQKVLKSTVSGETWVLRANLTGAAAADEAATFQVSGTGSDVVGDTTGNAITESVAGASTKIVTVTGGTLKVGLDTAVSPAINSLVNAATKDYLAGAFTIKAEDEDQRVTALRLHVEGTSVTSTDVRNLRVYLDGATTPLVQVTQLSIDAGISYASWSSADKLFEIPANTTRKLKVLVDVAPTGAVTLGNDFRVDINETWHVTSTGKSTNTNSTRNLLSNNAITHTVQPFTVTVSEASPAVPSANVESNPSTGTLLAKFKLMNSGAVSVTTTQFQIFNNGSCTLQGTTGLNTNDCDGQSVHYSLKTSAENQDSTTNLVSSHNTYDQSNEGNTGRIKWETAAGSSTLLDHANVVISGGRYRTFGIYISSTEDDFASGSTWQFSISTEGDVLFDVAESALGYDGDLNGTQVSSITGLKARGKPSLPTITDKTT